MTRRREKLVPWYHVVKSRCKVLTARGADCKNSASYVARSGMNGSTEELPACKTHADILLLDPDIKWKIKTIRERFINI